MGKIDLEKKAARI